MPGFGYGPKPADFVSFFIWAHSVVWDNGRGRAFKQITACNCGGGSEEDDVTLEECSAWMGYESET